MRELPKELLRKQCPGFNIEVVSSGNPAQLDLRKLVNPKLDLDIKLEPYFQVLNKENNFIANLSILDLLFSEGPNAVSYLENQKINFNQINSIQK